ASRQDRWRRFFRNECANPKKALPQLIRIRLGRLLPVWTGGQKNIPFSLRAVVRVQPRGAASRFAGGSFADFSGGTFGGSFAVFSCDSCGGFIGGSFAVFSGGSPGAAMPNRNIVRNCSPRSRRS